MIECTCKKWPDWYKDEFHEWDCPYKWMEETQR